MSADVVKPPYEPSYSTMNASINPTLSVFGRGPDLLVCDSCGSLVGDTETHDEWHGKGSSAPSQGVTE